MEFSLFLLEGRVGRRKYGTMVLCFLGGFLLLNLVFNLGINVVSNTAYDSIGIFLLAGKFTLKILLSILLVLISYKRLQDINNKGFYSIVCAIPYIQIPAVLLLLFLKGTPEENKVDRNYLKTDIKSQGEIATDSYDKWLKLYKLLK